MLTTLKHFGSIISGAHRDVCVCDVCLCWGVHVGVRACVRIGHIHTRRRWRQKKMTTTNTTTLCGVCVLCSQVDVLCRRTPEETKTNIIMTHHLYTCTNGRRLWEWVEHLCISSDCSLACVSTGGLACTHARLCLGTVH